NLTAGRPQRLLHGDFHEGNLMFSDNGELYVIDLFDEGFGFCGDPWYDFRLLIRTAGTRFIQGLIRGYFNGEAPEAFWEVLTYYVVASALCEIVWLAYNKPDELPAILEQNEKNARLLREGRLPAKLLYTGVF
ncbi:MAG: phosphotransferase, partial [Eubacteriales bacterium]|nr:phosphotransferase [Eubacteriales bacterium]